MRKYRPSNRVPFGSFVLLIIVGIITGVGLGLALWEISNLMQFLAFVIVIIAGLLAGGILTLVVKIGKVRSPFIAGLIGLLTGILLYGTYQYASYYITFRDDARAAYAENASKAPNDTQLDHQLDLILQDEVGSTGFIGYLMFNAKVGLTITSSPNSSSATDSDLTGAGVWIYWAAELLMAAGFAGWLAASAARKPFDGEANAWYGKPTLFASASTKSRKALIKALKDGDFQTAGSLLSIAELKYPHIDLNVRRGPSADTTYSQEDIFLTINHVQRKGRSSVIRSGVISPSEFKLLNLAMSQSGARPATERGAASMTSF